MKPKKKSGFSLVEVMVALLLLTALALGGAAVMYQTGGNIQRQQNKREAIVAAGRVLEKYWNTTYVANSAGDGLANIANSTISETLTINGNSMPASVLVSAENTDADGGKYYDIQVSIFYLAGEPVVLDSRRYERGLSRATVN